MMTVKIKDVTDGFIKEIEALKAERDALASQVEALKYYIIKYQELGAEFILNEALSKTPQQCLRDVQADAVQAGLDVIGSPATKFGNKSDDFVAGFNFCASLLQQHAATVRQGGAE